MMFGKINSLFAFLLVVFTLSFISAANVSVVSFIPSYSNVDVDTSAWSTTDGTVNLNVSEISILNGNATIKGFSNWVPQNLSHRLTRGIGVYGSGDPDELDFNLISSSEAIQIDFNKPVVLHSLELRSLYANEGPNYAFPEIANVYFKLSNGTIVTQNITGVEIGATNVSGSASEGRIISNYSYNITQIVFYVDSINNPSAKFSDFAVTKLTVESIEDTREPLCKSFSQTATDSSNIPSFYGNYTIGITSEGLTRDTYFFGETVSFYLNISEDAAYDTTPNQANDSWTLLSNFTFSNNLFTLQPFSFSSCTMQDVSSSNASRRYLITCTFPTLSDGSSIESSNASFSLLAQGNNANNVLGSMTFPLFRQCNDSGNKSNETMCYATIPNNSQIPTLYGFYTEGVASEGLTRDTYFFGETVNFYVNVSEDATFDSTPNQSEDSWNLIPGFEFSNSLITMQPFSFSSCTMEDFSTSNASRRYFLTCTLPTLPFDSNITSATSVFSLLASGNDASVILGSMNFSLVKPCPSNNTNQTFVEICHVAGKSGNNQTLSIPTSALNAHLGHGDTLGACVNDTKPGNDNPGSSGGGSGGSGRSFKQTGSDGCFPEWVFSEWSTCVNGTQTRTATDTLNCVAKGFSIAAPVVQQSCIMIEPSTENEPENSQNTSTGSSNFLTGLSVGDLNNDGNKDVSPKVLGGILSLLGLSGLYFFIFGTRRH